MKKQFVSFITVPIHLCQNCSMHFISLHAIVYNASSSRIANEKLETYFPGVAKRYHRCITYMKEHYNISPSYGYFWNFCCNGPRGNIKLVHCRPHVDAKNIALGICILYVYGK
jgi:hypothetical protein